LVAERFRVDLGDVETVQDVEADDFVTDEGEVQIARPRPAGIKRGAAGPAHAGHGAPPQDHPGALGNGLPDEVAELLEAFWFTAERELDDPLAHLLLGHPV